MCSRVTGCWTSRCTDRCVGAVGHPSIAERDAQATVEAALLIPSFLTVLLLALQPVCMLYTSSVMESAASETARILITNPSDTEAIRAFALRRLAAVPDLSIFHVGGRDSWNVEVSASGGGGGANGGENTARVGAADASAGASGSTAPSGVSVRISGSVRPLPMLGAFAGLMGSRDANGDVAIEVEVGYAGRPQWLEGDYDSWISIWD